VGGVKRHCVVFCMYVHWSWRSIARECELPWDFSSTARRTITNPMPGGPSMHLPDAATIAVDRVLRDVDVNRAERAHRIDDEAAALPAQACAMSGSWFRIPVPVSQCTARRA
jgi:hypothetical protein